MIVATFFIGLCLGINAFYLGCKKNIDCFLVGGLAGLFFITFVGLMGGVSGYTMVALQLILAVWTFYLYSKLKKNNKINGE